MLLFYRLFYSTTSRVYKIQVLLTWTKVMKSYAGCPGGARLDELVSLLSAWLLCGPWWPLLLGRNNCGGLDDQFVIAHGRRGRYG
jgi:hypothetical protein